MGLSYEQKSCCTRCSSSFLTLVLHHKNVRTNESKAKGLDQAFFPKGLGLFGDKIGKTKRLLHFTATAFFTYYYLFLFSLFSTEALMKSAKSFWGLLGRDLNSGWNCTPMNQG